MIAGMVALDRIANALGPPQVFREINTGHSLRPQAAIARWRHAGGFVDRSSSDTYQLVFNISSGQVVELRSRETTLRKSIVAGDVGVVCPDEPTSIEVFGTADTLHFFFTREWIQSLTGNVETTAEPKLTSFKPQLQAAAAQVLVELDQEKQQSAVTLETVVASIATRFVNSLLPGSRRSLGGLSPGARRRIRALIGERFSESGLSDVSLTELAAAAGLSVHHFIKAFRVSEGATPYAHLLAHRIEKSLPLLLVGNVHVDQIADNMGFSSASHFVSAFRKYMGVTPGALRDAARNIEH